MLDRESDPGGRSACGEFETAATEELALRIRELGVDVAGFYPNVPTATAAGEAPGGSGGEPAAPGAPVHAQQRAGLLA